MTTIDTAVSAAIVLYGYFGDPDAAASGPESLTARVGTAAPPFFVAHGERDALVPPGDARRFVERLRQTSTNPVVYAELPGGQHTFDMAHSIRFELVVNAIESFTAWVRSQC